MTSLSSFAVRLATSSLTTRSVCRAAISRYAETVSDLKTCVMTVSHMLTLNPGQASQPEACPICLHEPVNVNDCKPNKALRTTIKVFLRKKVMERETAEKKKKAAEKAAAVLATPITPLPNETLAALAGQPSQIPAAGASEVGTPAVSEVKQSSPSASQAAETPNGPPAAKELGIPTEAQKDVPQMSIEVRPYCHRLAENDSH